MPALPIAAAGWGAPAAAAPWGYVPPAPPRDQVAEGRLLSGRAIAIVVVSIALGAAYQGAVKLLERDNHISVPQLVRWNIALNVLVYAVVGVLVFSQVTPKIRIRWGDGAALTRVAFGAAFGLAGGGLVVALKSGAAGHLSSDPRALQMLSGGDVAHVIVTFLLVCAAAPLVEETLFRGLLLESLRSYHLGMAVIVSAMFFAVWHLNKAGLVYYTVMGSVFGGVYVKRGLVASMSAHAGFNGVLTVAALAIVLGPAHTYSVGGLRITVPSGWTKEDPSTALKNGFPIPVSDSSAIVLDGPDAAGLAMLDLGPTSTPFNPNDFGQRIQQRFRELPTPDGLSFDTSSVRQTTLPTVGTAVEMDATIHATHAEYTFFGYGGDIYMVFAVTGDGTRPRGDVTKMLDSLQPWGSGT